jgi:hypothetical protein
LRTFHSRNSHSPEGAAGGPGRAAAIAEKRIHLHYSLWGQESKESHSTKAVANSRKHPYPAHKPQQDQMKRLLLLALTAATLLMGTTASAHCDQKHGHQETSSQSARK